MPEKQSETLNELKKFIELEQSLQSITQESGPFRKHLPVVQQAYELRRRIADDKSAWVDEAHKSLQALADIGLETAKKSLTEPQQSEDTLRRALEEAVDEFHKRWRELFEEIQATMTKACKQLGTSIAQGISRGIRAHAIESTCQAVEEALKRVREFRETIEEEQARETPAGRRKRLDEFCEKHRCTYEDVCTSANVSRSSLYAWLNGKAPVVGARIEHLLDGEIPSQKSGSS
jgi:AcrR family transcriptional regulator